MTEEARQTAVCKNCGNQFVKIKEEDSDNEKLLCSHCLVKQAEQHIPEKVKISKPKLMNTRKAWKAIRLIIIFASIFIISVRTPKLISVMKEQKPIRSGTYETNSKADQCIKNLWHISRLLQEGKQPEKDIVCPVSNKPYVLKRINEDIVAYCPNPDLHGFKEIRVSKTSPRPEVIQ